MLFNNVHAAIGPALLIPVRRMDQHEHVVLFGQFKLLSEVFVFRWRLVVVPNLADRHHAFLGEEPRQNIHHLFRQRLIVRLFAV